MSWTWWQPGEGVCFDNIEALGLGKRQDEVAAIYEQAAQFLAQRGYGRVTVGTGNSDLEGGKYWPHASRPLRPPAGVYTDAQNQWLLAESEATLRQRSNGYVAKVHLGYIPTSDEEAMRRVAEEVYPDGWDFLDDEDPDLYVVLYHGNEVVGYAAVETAQRYINDFVVLDEHRGSGALFLGGALLAVMRGIALPGEEWRADARESTSYALLQALERRGRISIVDATPGKDRIGEDAVFKVRFTLKN